MSWRRDMLGTGWVVPEPITDKCLVIVPKNLTCQVHEIRELGQVLFLEKDVQGRPALLAYFPSLQLIDSP